MKIYVYAIAKDEIDNVERFMNSVKDADGVFVADTGSTDGTQELLRKLGAVVHDIVVEPFRFDEARNIALSFVPDDVDLCISMDLDEFISSKNWREQIEELWEVSKGKVNKIFNTNIYSDTLTQITTKIHTKQDYIWKNRCHEYLEYIHEVSEENPEYIGSSPELVTVHVKDNSKDRSFYYDLLEMDYKENSNDFHAAFNYGREMMYRKEYQNCIDILLNCLCLHGLNPKYTELTNLCLRIVAHCYYEMEDYNKALNYCFLSIGVIRNRESWLQMAEIASKMQNWNLAQMACVECIKEEFPGIEHSGRTYDFTPYSFLLQALFNMGVYDECLKILSDCVIKFKDNTELVEMINKDYSICYAKMLEKGQRKI